MAILEQRKFDDEDVTSDVEFLTERLQSSVQDLSSFDEYSTEVSFFVEAFLGSISIKHIF